MGVIETWVVVSGGNINAVCRSGGVSTANIRSSHLHSLARSVVSSAFNVVPRLAGMPVTVPEVRISEQQFRTLHLIFFGLLMQTCANKHF